MTTHTLNDLHIDAISLLNAAIKMKQAEIENMTDRDTRQLHPLIYALFCFTHSNPSPEELADYERRL
jgi:hypothetical protein